MVSNDYRVARDLDPMRGAGQVAKTASGSEKRSYKVALRHPSGADDGGADDGNRTRVFSLFSWSAEKLEQIRRNQTMRCLERDDVFTPLGGDRRSPGGMA